MTRIEIPISEENLWFLERSLSVFDFLDLFPLDAISSDKGPGIPVTITTDLGFSFDTDIDRTKMQLRNRSRHKGWMKWTNEHGLNLGDRIVIERTGARMYSLRLEPKERVSD